MRTIWCRDCGIGYASVNGDLPAVCPACDRQVIWLTESPAHASKPASDPHTPYTLTVNDKAMLKRRGIGEG